MKNKIKQHLSKVGKYCRHVETNKPNIKKKKAG